MGAILTIYQEFYIKPATPETPAVRSDMGRKRAGSGSELMSPRAAFLTPIGPRNKTGRNQTLAPGTVI